MFDFTVNLDTMAWEAWVVPAWEYPKVPAEVNFQSLLVPTVDSTRALAIIHHLQVGWRLAFPSAECVGPKGPGER